MATMIGNSSPAKLFGVIDPIGALTPQRLLFLLALGAVIVGLHEAVRWPLKLPGHHGIEGMALLVLGRLSCSHRWAATLVAASAAATSLAIASGHSVMTPVFYLVPGLLLDLGVMLLPHWRRHIWILPLLAGLAHAGKPVLRWLAAEGLNLEFGSLAQGLTYPLSLHLLFGASGGLATVMLWRWWVRPAEAGKAPV